MKRLTEDRLQEALKYMEDDLPNCLYLYGDVVNYGLNDPNILLWYSEKDGKINGLVMKYYTGAQVYSKDLSIDADEVCATLTAEGVDRISAQRPVAEAIHERLKDDFEVEYGGVFKLHSYRPMKKDDVVIEKAKAEDAEKIADLLMSHEMYSTTYERQSLTDEIRDRIEGGMGRSYIIRDGDRVVAHSAVSIETDQFAVEGLALVHDDFRTTLYGSFLDSYMVNDLGEEGKDIYALMLEGRRLDAFVKMGNEVLAWYGKLYRKGL